ncbi:T9SS type A sorting domain-containing protein [Hymenobacter gummosus]|uniref:T9SS type A sorting domain-containing protein n=1 Tax=Hymenobacter gummosus TaxID=1776032 RepID=A0A431U1I1_9BACT|nr:T9SS type A sorting domain-containing protein [Hymenobacter gummosus]RTQ48928.1 T9SS type A sorting domain-containing protein [Hymenobacter gummosus]
MKKLLLGLLVVGLGAAPAWAQSGGRGLWCPPGAVWQYMHMFADLSTPGPVFTPVRVSYAGDTIIGGQSCQVLQMVYASSTRIWRLYTRADADRVWLYAGGQFYKMYDFSARPGDTWLYQGGMAAGYFCPAPTRLTVDSVGQQLIGGQQRRWFTLANQPRLGRIYEGVGSLRQDFTPMRGACAPADPVTALLAQCYGTAAQPGLIVMGTMLSCQAQPTATHEARAEAAGFAVYPTVGSGTVTVKLPAGYARATVSVFSPAGQLVEQVAAAAATETRLQLRHLPRGLYLLRVQQPGQPPLTQRLVLQ